MMDDLINRQAAIDAVALLRIDENDYSDIYHDGYVDGVYDAEDAIKALPSVEAEPVRHGRWETDGMPMDDGEYLMTRCTVCGTAYEYGHNENYCGYCGAKMDEVT